ncbi:MAG: hypothetical protein FWB86_02835 [Treponema sp.]|nr:hypothetical protein [Treponema sp.]MCL2251705.1 hypothetical protein [Treponema sp.]
MIEKTSLHASSSRSHNVSDSKTTSLKAPVSSQQTAEVFNKQTTRSIFSVISSLGLPSDKLSASIISFARFFSLPLKPNVLAAIRQQAFSQTQQTAGNAALTGAANQTVASSSADTSFAMKMREAFSFAAAAAESKGVELNQKGIEQYAQAIDPDLHNRQEKERQQEKRRNKDQIEEEKTTITAASLEKNVNENTTPLIEMLNRMPGKNGQRWIVLPFNFSKDGKEFNISMRVLLENENRAVKMALQITENSEQRDLLFIFENNFMQQGESLSLSQFSRLTLYHQDELSSKEKEYYKKELSSILEIPIDQINVKKRTENFPFEGSCEEQLLMIDEMV